MKKILCAALMILFPILTAWAAGQWEKEGNFYFLAKNARDNFSAQGAGPNKFAAKFLKYEGIDFLVRGADAWSDYGRLDLGGNNFFSVPIQSGMKVDELHFLAGGSYGNSYEHDKLLRLYGENYYYSVITVTFVYQDGSYKILSAPVFWDWFHLGPAEWSEDGVRIKYFPENPVRKDCNMCHISFANPKASQPLKDILISDSWLSDRPFSDIFALTLKSSDIMEAAPRDRR
jgi:hypothetical protein